MSDKTWSVHAFTCAACRRAMPHATPSVGITPSWDHPAERLCSACWGTIMSAALDRLLVQEELLT
jgi:hypothetical protein